MIAAEELQDYPVSLFFHLNILGECGLQLFFGTEGRGSNPAAHHNSSKLRGFK
jgi:hypothetical protein